MRYTLLITILFVSCSFGALAQSKKSVKLLTKARQEMQKDNPEEALKKLDKALKDSPDYIEAMLFAAEIHQDRGDLESSLGYYQRAVDQKAPYFIYLFYGENLFALARYEEAIKAFEEYIKSPQAKKKYLEKVNRYIKNCEFAIGALANPKDYNPLNMGPKVNSGDMEYFPSISADGNTLVFTHRSVTGKKTDEDFFVSFRDPSSGEWSESSPLRGYLNTIQNEGAQTLTADGQTLFFAACERRDGYGSCDIYASFYDGKGLWSKPVNLGDSVNSRVWDSQPSISPDGKTLYFVRGSSSISKNIDIYYSQLRKNGRWGKAKKLAGKVNTKYQETSPFIHFDNQSLYFSSNGHPGMGDLDFFVSRKEENGEWGEPENIGYPINTSSQEFSLVVAPDGKTAYFASDNEDGNGLLDLYNFELPEEVRASEIAYIKGRVTNKVTGKPLKSGINFSDLDKNKVVLTEGTGKNGRYFSVLPANSDYALNIKKKGFLVYSRNFSLATQTIDRAFELNVELIPIEVGKKVKLENVFFSTDSYELDTRSFAELNEVVNFMQENETVKISVEGHTDNEGSPAHNQTLSKNRAKAVYNYLIDKGIAKERLSSKGYGDSQPVADNSTEEGRKQNRRTELKITAF
jgi:outer membrane protein OmpA-like peptidoglycan-associated protein/tetratricopeptide (TPR) repeat protein